MSMATKDTRLVVMADSGSPPGPGADLLAHPPPACHLPGYGPPGGRDRAQALLDLLAVALNALDRAAATRADTGAVRPADLEDSLPITQAWFRRLVHCFWRSERPLLSGWPATRGEADSCTGQGL
jgi:hypothetical protein